MSETGQLVLAVRELLGGDVKKVVTGAQRLCEHFLEISRGGGSPRG